MYIIRPLVVALLSLTVFGCGTKYQDMSFTGGVAAHQMSADVFRIESRGNSYTGKNTVQDYMLFKAAETTKSAGKTHFILIDSADASSTASIVNQGTATTRFNGDTAQTTYSPATVSHYFKPGADAYIRVISVVPGSQIPAGAISADEIIQFVGVRVQRG